VTFPGQAITGYSLDPARIWSPAGEASTADPGKEVMSMASGQDWLNAGRNPILRLLIIYFIRRIRERRRERR
jgi:hypothetical protein